MTTVKSFSDLEQSKKLADILPLESADMCYINGSVGKIHIGGWKDEMHDEDDIPCWSLAALLSVLPDESKDNHFLTLSKEKDEYCCCYEDINGNSFRHTFANNPVDACYEMIIRLNELKML